jgi:hypothetical protein
MKETYKEINKRHQDEINKLPLYWAFGKDQWLNLLAELGLTEENAAEHLVNAFGAIVRKEDVPMIAETLERHHAEMQEAMKDLEFFEEATLYEMNNHEYAINLQGDYDVINALGFDVEYSDGNELAECSMTDEQKVAYLRARNRHNKMAIDNEWF